MDEGEARLPQARGEEAGEPMHAGGDFGEALRPMVDRIHARHHREEDLRSADIRRGLVAADVLLAGLEGEAITALALGVLGNANQPAGKDAAHLFLRRHEGRMRAAEAHGDPEALGRTDADVRAHFARRLVQDEGEQVGGERGDGARGLRLRRNGGEILDLSGGGRVLEQDAEDIRLDLHLAGLDHLHFDVERQGARLHHRDGLGVDVIGDQEHVPLSRSTRVGHVHGFRGGRALVEERGVGERQGGQVRHHGLEIEQGLETTLRDLRLIRGVLGVPAGILEDVASDHRGREAAGVAHADERAPGLVRLRDRGDAVQKLALGEGSRQIQGPAQADAGRNGFFDQGVKSGGAEGGEHSGPVRGGGAYVPA